MLARCGEGSTSAVGDGVRGGDAATVGRGGAADAAPGRVADGVLERDRLGGLHVVQALDVVLFGGGVAAALLGEHVDDDRAVPLGGVREGLLHVLDVVAVDRPGVADAQRLEEGVGRHHVAQRAGHRVHARIGQLAEGRQLAQAHAQAFPRRGVGRVEAQGRQALGQLGHGRGVGAAVVVEHNDDATLRVPEVVEGLVGHAAGQRAVTDDGDHLALAVDAAQLEPAGDPVGVGERGRRVAVLDPVVLGLGPVGVARHAARLLQGLEAVAATGQQLVHVGLVAGVPEDDVARGVEDAVQGERQLDGAEIRAEVPPGRRHRVDDERPDLLAQLGELLFVRPLRSAGVSMLGRIMAMGSGYPLACGAFLAPGAQQGAHGDAEGGQGQDLQAAGGARGSARSTRRWGRRRPNRRSPPR